jgi:glycerol-3-phosphate dehydrogenase
MSARVDIVIVGGGIHGVGVAQAAAAAGHSVLLLERTGLATGTSSRSSKLIHGGLRYLESAQFRLVRESLAERARLLRLAPGLVRLVPFHIPVYRDTTRRPTTIRLGLTLYALLGGGTAATRFTRVPRQAWDALDGLATDGLQTVFRYFDAQTDDVALTHAVMRSAQALGAELACPAEFVGAEHTRDGYAIRYRHDGREKNCHAAVLINAAGAWANDVLARVTPVAQPAAIELIQGTHLVLDTPVQAGCYYVEALQDRRAVFVLPWKNLTLLGTTETRYHGDPAAVRPLPEEEQYLLDTYARYFPRQTARVVERFAGLRVLPESHARAFHRPRDTLYHRDPQQHPRLLTLYGGKLTGYRLAAAQALARLRAVLPTRAARADTATLPLAV